MIDTGRRLRLDPREERGAVVVIVALVLIAMFGMLVLVVDVGGLLWKRRELVNASDAAALSAAHTCALKSSVDGKDSKQAADPAAAANVSGTGLTGTVVDSGGCHTGSSGWVKVQYSQPQHLFFAPVLGFSNTNGVTTKATAIWGPAGAANPVPIVIYQNNFNDCRLQDPTPEPTCYVWEDNSNTSGSQNGFGFLDLRIDPSQPRDYGWDSQAGAKCNNPGSAIKGWIQNYPDSAVGDLPIRYPQPTYACLASGGKSSAFGNDAQKDGPLYSLIGQVLLFPLNRCDPASPATFGQLAKGSPVPCGNTPDQYDIVGFVAMRITAIYTPKDAAGTTTACGNIMQNFAASPPNTVIDLDNFSGTCGAYQDLANVKVKKGGCCTDGTEYTYDPVAHTITWKDGAKTGVNITWDSVSGQPCGTPPANNNSGHCMVVQVVEVQVGGTDPGHGDPNSNVRAVKLCDPTVSRSCDPISVPST